MWGGVCLCNSGCPSPFLSVFPCLGLCVDVFVFPFLRDCVSAFLHFCDSMPERSAFLRLHARAFCYMLQVANKEYPATYQSLGSLCPCSIGHIHV